MPQESAIFGASQEKTRVNIPDTWRILGKTALALIIANEIRGLILAVPLLYAMAQADSWMALWIGFCSLAGVALSVVVPLWVAKKWRLV